MNVHPKTPRTSTSTGVSATDSTLSAGERHHVLDTVAAALALPIEVVASIFTTTHHDSWEDAVARYDHDHPDHTAAATSLASNPTGDRSATPDSS
jgi:hypothetical protein